MDESEADDQLIITPFEGQRYEGRRDSPICICNGGFLTETDDMRGGDGPIHSSQANPEAGIPVSYLTLPFPT